MQYGFEFMAARPKRAVDPDEAPSREPMKPIGEIRRNNTTTDERKVKRLRQVQRTAGMEMDPRDRETDPYGHGYDVGYDDAVRGNDINPFHPQMDASEYEGWKDGHDDVTDGAYGDVGQSTASRKTASPWSDVYKDYGVCKFCGYDWPNDEYPWGIDCCDPAIRAFCEGAGVSIGGTPANKQAEQAGYEACRVRLTTASRKTAVAVLPSGVVPVDVEQLVAQIGKMNVMAISGFRVNAVYNPDGDIVGVELPVSNGYSVRVLMHASDTYIVQRCYRDVVKGQMDGIYNDQVGEIAYQASNFHNGPFGTTASRKMAADDVAICSEDLGKLRCSEGHYAKVGDPTYCPQDNTRFACYYGHGMEKAKTASRKTADQPYELGNGGEMGTDEERDVPGNDAVDPNTRTMDALGKLAAGDISAVIIGPDITNHTFEVHRVGCAHLSKRPLSQTYHDWVITAPADQIVREIERDINVDFAGDYGQTVDEYLDAGEGYTVKSRDIYIAPCVTNAGVVASKENNVDTLDSLHKRETEILAAMHTASLADQQALSYELDELRAKRAEIIQRDREVNFAQAVVRDTLTPVATHTLHTSATDWLDEVALDGSDQRTVANKMHAEATVWFNRLHQAVIANDEEFTEQALGTARRSASGYHDRDQAENYFLEAAANLRRQAIRHLAGEPDGAPKESSRKRATIIYDYNNLPPEGTRHRVKMPYSEVCMHLGVAGKEMLTQYVGNHMVQILNDDGSPVSFPITMGEAGWLNGSIVASRKQVEGSRKRRSAARRAASRKAARRKRASDYWDSDSDEWYGGDRDEAIETERAIREDAQAQTVGVGPELTDEEWDRHYRFTPTSSKSAKGDEMLFEAAGDPLDDIPVSPLSNPDQVKQWMDNSAKTPTEQRDHASCDHGNGYCVWDGIAPYESSRRRRVAADEKSLIEGIDWSAPYADLIDEVLDRVQEKYPDLDFGEAEEKAEGIVSRHASLRRRAAEGDAPTDGTPIADESGQATSPTPTPEHDRTEFDTMTLPEFQVRGDDAENPASAGPLSRVTGDRKQAITGDGTSSRRLSHLHREASEDDPTIECPKCGRDTNAYAEKCAYCGHLLSTVLTGRRKFASEPVADDSGQGDSALPNSVPVEGYNGGEAAFEDASFDSAGEGGDDAADVASVPTPGSSVADYPQPTQVTEEPDTAPATLAAKRAAFRNLIQTNLRGRQAGSAGFPNSRVVDERLQIGMARDHAESLSIEELEEMMMMDGLVEAADGCAVEPDGTCPHGYPSPLLILGYI